MAKFSIWAVVRRNPDGQYRVRVRAMPLHDRGGLMAQDDLSEIAPDLAQATALRDRFIGALRMKVIARGGTIESVDATIDT